MRIKKIAAFTAALMLMIPAAAYIAADGGCSFVVSAEEKIQKDDFVFEVMSDGTAVLNSYAGDAEEVVIPSSVTDDAGNEYKVTVLGENCFKSNGMKSVTIPASVNRFNGLQNFGYQFADCVNLQSVIFEEGSQLKEISDRAFRGCEKLREINIPDSVKLIGLDAFNGCTNLSYVSAKGVETIEDNAFCNCIYLENVETGNNLTDIGFNAFGCTGITSFNFPKTITAIGESAFNGCGSLEKIVFEEGSNLKEIGAKAFCDTGITSVIIPKSVKTIYNDVFYGCKDLETVTFEEGSVLTSIGNSVFENCISLTQISFPDSLTSIGNNAFSGDKSLTSVKLSKKISTINYETFLSCERLKDINLENIVDIGGRAFVQCLSLNEIDFSSIVTIGESAFAGNESLTSVEFGEKLSTVSSWAFTDCPNLKSITIPDGVLKIGNRTFGYHGIESKPYEGVVIYGTPGTKAEDYVNGTGGLITFVDISTSEPVSPSDSNFANGIYCDVNGDGTANVMDLALMKKYLLLGE